jgi:hypothetical protein
VPVETTTLQSIMSQAVFGPIATPEFVTRQAKPPNQFRGHITPCQSDSQAHVSFFATGLF